MYGFFILDEKIQSSRFWCREIIFRRGELLMWVSEESFSDGTMSPLISLLFQWPLHMQLLLHARHPSFPSLGSSYASLSLSLHVASFQKPSHNIRLPVQTLSGRSHHHRTTQATAVTQLPSPSLLLLRKAHEDRKYFCLTHSWLSWNATNTYWYLLNQRSKCRFLFFLWDRTSLFLPRL